MAEGTAKPDLSPLVHDVFISADEGVHKKEMDNENIIKDSQKKRAQKYHGFAGLVNLASNLDELMGETGLAFGRGASENPEAKKENVLLNNSQPHDMSKSWGKVRSSMPRVSPVIIFFIAIVTIMLLIMSHGVSLSSPY